MIKLTTTDIAKISTDNEFYNSLVEATGVDLSELITQTAMRDASGNGAMFADNLEDPKFCIIIFTGTFKLESEKTCVILHAHGELSSYNVAALTIKQFAKEKECKSVCFGDFNAPINEGLWDKFDNLSEITLHVGKI